MDDKKAEYNFWVYCRACYVQEKVRFCVKKCHVYREILNGWELLRTVIGATQDQSKSPKRSR